MTPPDNPFGAMVVSTWRDLQRKYVRDKPAIHATWLSLSLAQRKELILSGADGGESGFLRHRDDARLGNVRFIIPELNIRDLTTGDTALAFLERRATTSVLGMYPYDAHTMRTSMRVNGISHSTGRKKGAVMMFIEEDQYGACMELGAKARGNEMDTLLQMGNGCILIENEGMMVLERQGRLYNFLSLLVDDIMDMKRTLEDPDGEKKIPKRKKAAVASKEEIEKTLQRLEVAGSSRKAKGVKPKVSLKDAFDRLAQDSQEQFLSTDDHVNLIREEPLYFSHIANNYFFSSPGMAPDEKGESEHIYSGDVATKSTLALLRDAYQAAAYWRYLSSLASSLAKDNQHTTEKIRSPLTDELWATCSKELLRARTVYRRFVQTELKYAKFFVRTGPTIQLKGTLDAVAKKNQFASWILQLAAKTEYSDIDTVQLLNSLDAFQETVIKARELISERMGDALADIAVVVAFMARLRQVIVVPTHAVPSAFEKELVARTVELEKACSGIDLVDYVFPVENLKEPAACQDCFRVIDARLSSADLGDLSTVFREPVEGSVRGVFAKLTETGAASQRSKEVPFDPFINSASTEPAQPSSIHTKPKTHGTPTPRIAGESTPQCSPQCSPRLKAEPIFASPSAIKTFRKLFRSDSRGAIPWAAFTAAMTNVGFTIEPIGGSISRFRPPGTTDSPISLHRPHPTDKLEGWALLRVASRLRRRFGWSVDTFVAAKR